MIEDWPENARALADAGLPFMLTGHSHMHNIAPTVTPTGNHYWDINTSALVGWPGKFRELQIENDIVHITSREIPYTPAFGELSARKFLQESFDVVLRNIFDGWEHDYDLFVRSIGMGSINPAPLYKLKWILKPAGKIVCKITLGALGWLLLCRVPKEARKILLCEMLIEGLRNIYAGEEPYGSETGVGKAMLAYGKRLRFLGKRLGIAGFPAFLLSLVYDDSPDDEVTIPLD
jgi:hypothetical protein